MKPGITAVSASLLCLVGGATHAPPGLDVPPGFSATLYASGLGGAHELDVDADGTLTLSAGKDRIEISPPTADEPVTVMRVATELAAPRAAQRTTLVARAPRFVQVSWNAIRVGDELAANGGVDISVSPHTLALARALARRDDADVAVAADGTLFVADSRAGAVWRVRRTAL